MKEKMKEELYQIREMREQIRSKLINAPGERVRGAICKGSFQYYIGKKYQRRGNLKQVKEICERDYLMELDKRLAKREAAMALTVKRYDESELEDVYRNLHPGHPSGFYSLK